MLKPQNIKLGLYALLLILIASFVNYFFVLILTFYFAMMLYLYNKPKITSKLKHLYFYIGYVYPAVAMFIRFILDAWYPQATLLNRFEHTLFSIVLALTLYLIFHNNLKKFNLLESAIFIIGLVVVFGNFNEFAEFIVRPYMSIDFALKQTLFYSDTIFDLMMNVLGGTLGFIIARKIIS